MPKENLLLKAMRSGAEVVFDPHGSETSPFTAEVEILLGGVPIVTFEDGSEQFLDSYGEPVLAYSPRLPAGELEAFCEAHIDRYEAFFAEHGEERLVSDRIAIEAFW